MNDAKLSASVMNMPSDFQSRCQEETSLDGSEAEGLQQQKQTFLYQAKFFNVYTTFCYFYLDYFNLFNISWIAAVEFCKICMFEFGTAHDTPSSTVHNESVHLLVVNVSKFTFYCNHWSFCGYIYSYIIKKFKNTPCKTYARTFAK